MYYFCTNCHQIYDSSFAQFPLYGKKRLCPKVECGKSVVEIDDLIMPAIATFNKKGYITSFCCSGHPYDNCSLPYVQFEQYYNFPKELLPPDWAINKNNGGLYAFTFYNKVMDLTERIEYLSKINKDLLEFARKLDEI